MSDIAVFTFNKSGLKTSVQDMGRVCYRHFGVPAAGVMDSVSAKIANALVENDPETPILEITLMGPEIDIKGDCQMAITGADISPEIDGVSVPMYETLLVKSGAVLSFGRLRSGCRTYLAIRGTWRVKTWLGSNSASSCNGLMLTPDSIIKKRNKLMVCTKPHIPKKILPEKEIPEISGNIDVSVLPGPEFGMFSDEAINWFFNRWHYITINSDRMGYRLESNIPDFKPGREIISSGIVPGTIQITGSGQPIILMADAQTTGGYLRLGNVITPDLDRLAQLRPGDKIRFLLLQ